MSTGKEPSSSTTSSRFPQTHHHRLFRAEPFRVLLPPNSDSSASASLKRPLMEDEKGLDEEQQLRVSWNGGSSNGKRDHQLNINTADDHTTQQRTPVATVEGPSRSGGGGGGERSELMSIRRPRGRPPGSKNKTKPPIIVTRDSANTLHSQLMEIAAGSDIADAVATYSRKRQRCVCIVSGTGAVSNVTLRHSGSEGPAVMTLPGRYELVSVSGVFLPTQAPAPMAASGLSVLLAAGQGHLVGGIVVGNLIAAGPVILVAASSANVAFERLPLITNQENDQEEDRKDQQTLIRVDADSGGGSAPPPAAAPCYGIPATSTVMSSVPFLPALYNLPGNGARQRSPF